MVVDTELASSSPAGLPYGTEVRFVPGSLVKHDMAIVELSPGSFRLCRLVGSSKVAEHIVKASEALVSSQKMNAFVDPNVEYAM